MAKKPKQPVSIGAVAIQWTEEGASLVLKLDVHCPPARGGPWPRLIVKAKLDEGAAMALWEGTEIRATPDSFPHMPSGGSERLVQ